MLVRFDSAKRRHPAQPNPIFYNLEQFASYPETDGGQARTPGPSSTGYDAALISVTWIVFVLFPTAYEPLLRHVLGVIRSRFPARDLREVGRTAAKEHLNQVKGRARNYRIEFALSLLKALGGDATILESEGRRLIYGDGCPLSGVTAHHPEACLMLEALLSEIIGIPVKERCRHGEAPRCCFEVST